MIHDSPLSQEVLSRFPISPRACRNSSAPCAREHCIVCSRSLVATLLNRMDFGILCVSHALTVTFMNECAQELCLQNDGLSIQHDRLVLSEARAAITVQELMKPPLSQSGARISESIVRVSRRSMRRPLEVVIIPALEAALPEKKASSILLVFDPERPLKARTEFVSNLYGLTSSEARLAMILMQGKTLDEASLSLHRAKETVRKQLQSIFDKTSTNRQGELIALLHRGAASLRL